MRKINSIGLCAVLALALLIVAAPSALARGARRAHVRNQRVLEAEPARSHGTVLVLKAGGQIVPNGALVHVTAPNYFFKTKVTVEGTSKKAAKEVEVECSTEYFEQGNIVRNFGANAWSVVETHGIDFCEGEEWFSGHGMEHPLVFSAPNVVSDETTVELFRTEEQIKAEELEEFHHEEPIKPREPRRCVYKSVVARGHFKSKKGAPLVAKVKGRMELSPTASNKGCSIKAKWKAEFTLTYKGVPIVAALEPAPTITSVVPMEGPEPGTTVMISGTGFTGASTVLFGTKEATTFHVNSDSSITAVAPAGMGTVDVRVITPVTETSITPADRFTYAVRPSVIGVSPKVGPEKGGTEVTITGTNYGPESKVYFGSTPATGVKVNSAESVNAVSPAGAGTLNVTVENAGGTSMVNSADKFTYVPPPVVKALNPKEGVVGGGEKVVITGSNLHEVSAVMFGSESATSIKEISATEIEVVSPASHELKTGPVNVTVTTPGGTSATGAEDEFTYHL
jgi:hypothetical protein